MRASLVFFLCLVFAAPACSKKDERTFTLQGQVLSLEPARKLLTVIYVILTKPLDYWFLEERLYQKRLKQLAAA